MHNFGLLSWNCFKIWNLLGLYKNATCSLKFSTEQNFTVYSAFLPSIEKSTGKLNFIHLKNLTLKKDTVKIKDLVVITRWIFLLSNLWNFLV